MRYIPIFLFIPLLSCGHGHGHGHGHGGEANNTTDVETITLTPAQMREHRIGIGVVSRKKLRSVVRAMGEFQPRVGGEAFVVAPFKGTLLPLEKSLAPGALVEKGQLLGSLAPLVPSGSLTGASSAYKSAWTRFQAQKKRADRVARMVTAGVESRAALYDARARLEVARSAVNSAWGQLSRLKKAGRGSADTENTRLLHSPITGTVMSASYVSHLFVPEGRALYHIVDTRSLGLKVLVFHSDYHAIAAKVKGWFTLPGEKTRVPLTSAPSLLMDAGHKLARSVALLFEMPNTGGEYHVGQHVQVHLERYGDTKHLVVPRSAVVRDGFFTVVYVAKAPGQFVRRSVELSGDDEEFFTVVSGLKEGERIVTENPIRVQYIRASVQLPVSAHAH